MLRQYALPILLCTNVGPWAKKIQTAKEICVVSMDVKMSVIVPKK